MKPRIKRLAAGMLFAVAITGGAGYFASTRQGSGVAQAAVIAQEQTAARVVAEGVVVPASRAALSASLGGRVVEVVVPEGDLVPAGGPVLRLDDTRERAARQQAFATLAGARARLDQLRNGTRPQELDAGAAGVAQAEALLVRARQGALPEEVAGANASVANAQAALDRLLEGASTQALIVSQVDVANAEAALSQAQAAYDKVAGAPDVGASREALQLAQASNTLQAAQARLLDLTRGASAADLAGARARLAQARSQRDALLAAVRPADVAAAEAEVRRAMAQYALLQAGARPEAVAAAEADVAVAEALLEQAEAALAERVVRSPFDATVVRVDARVGEEVAPGAVIAQVAELTNWLVETVDVTELQVANVQPGDRVRVTIDALPDFEVDGEVVQVGGYGQNIKGDVSYKVVVKPMQADPRLKWNMTAAVAFDLN